MGLVIFRDIMNMHRKGKHKVIWLITSIDSSLVQVIEEFLSIEVEVKHISDVSSRQFVVSDVAVLEIPNLEKIFHKLTTK
jgi:CRISPR/Cas system endoribonuclease Cas6 (RAMP superfamily)